MINILKQLEGWVTALKQNKFRYATLRLTAFYVFSTAVILLVSSLAVLIIFTPDNSYESGFFKDDYYLEEEIEHDEFSLYEIRENLPVVITLVDLFILMIISILAYHFARQTLLPIKEVHEKQQKFMSDIAHELRTPLSVLMVGAEATLNKDREISEYKEFICDVKSEADRLTRLSNQLLSLLRFEQTDDVLTTNINLSKLVTTTTSNFISYANSKKVAIKFEAKKELYIKTNPDILIEILQNLLKNATDYNKVNGAIDVSIAEKEDVCVIKILDTGIGIPKEKIDLVFDRFVKVDNARTQTLYSGTGLGLAIVKDLISKIGGSIQLSSEINKGTEVTIFLPKIHS